MALTKITSTNIGANAVTNAAIGYTPANKAGDTFTGSLFVRGDPVSLVANGVNCDITARASTSGYASMVIDGYSNSYMFLKQAGADVARITANTTNLALATGASNIDRLVIDASGRVTMPYQPAFHAYGGGSQSGNNVIIAFTTTSHNNGSCYSTSTYRFTAPVSGTYCFSATFMNGGQAIVARWGLQKNGTTYGNELYGLTNVYFRSNGTWIVPMSTNDYVTIVAGLPGNPCDIHDNYRHFSGYLLG